ncbi:hypothetical protein BKA70DRAFT_1452003 [Coprinopsis sp. MPI-PUGE-AT-0042]|nr:hypothetical protein BKA70DRAFT_1452003 [Coprinopsis sp. MPI-PUGE-AT-0042]
MFSIDTIALSSVSVMAHKTAVSTPAGSSNVYHQFVTGKYPYGAGHPGPTKSHAEGTMSYAKVAAMPPGTSGKAQHPVQYYESHDGFVPKFRSDGGTMSHPQSPDPLGAEPNQSGPSDMCTETLHASLSHPDAAEPRPHLGRVFLLSSPWFDNLSSAFT